MAEHLEAVHVGHVEVEEDEAGLFLLGHRQSGLPIEGGYEIDVLLSEACLEETMYVLRVVYDKHRVPLVL